MGVFDVAPHLGIIFMGGRGCVIVTPVQRHVMALGVRCGESGPYHSKARIARCRPWGSW